VIGSARERVFTALTGRYPMLDPEKAVDVLQPAGDGLAGGVGHDQRLTEVPSAQGFLPEQNPLWDAAVLLREEGLPSKAIPDESGRDDG